MEVTKEIAQQITREIETYAKEVFKRYGLAAGKVSTRYGIAYEVKFEASLETLDKSGVNLTSREALAYQQLHDIYNLPGDLLGKVFRGHTKNGYEEFTFAGIASSRSKYPFVGINEAGEKVFFTEAVRDNIKDAV